jgi:hypothetical protein
MDDITFWRLIDETRKASGNSGHLQAKLLIEELIRLPEEDIISFHMILEAQMDRAYNRDLWSAAYIINCGCSSDGFMDFRAWLVGQGQSVFENALSDPETLVDVVAPNTDTLVQKLMNVAKHAYLEKKGVAIPLTPHKVPDLTGNQWNESTLSQKYPKLHARFGNCEEWLEFFEDSGE